MQKDKKRSFSVVIIAKNEEKKIKDCLKSVVWADEIILIDNDSIDKTGQIAKSLGAKVVKASGDYTLKYSKLRNLGLKRAKSKWIFYLDADERVTPELRDEILNLLRKKKRTYGSYAIPRRNIILGKEMKHGGWWPDYVKRLFRKDKLKKWKGDLHEEPVFKGKMGHFENPLIHIKHDNLEEMVEKTNKWSELEAKMLYESHHPKMAWWRFIRIMLTELWLRLIVKKGFLDGPEGVIYSFYQAWSKFVTYAKLWEIQLEVKKS
jgi:glycosyltransferase involved in cell wall biosynthesis